MDVSEQDGKTMIQFDCIEWIMDNEEPNGFRIENPTEEDATSYMNNKVNVVHKNLGKTAGLFDYSFELGSCLVTFNMDHIFYKSTLEDIFRSVDAKIAFELFVASLVKAVDETKKSQEEENDNLIAIWNEKLIRYINEQQNFAKK